MQARLSSSHLVGRVAELAELELAWREARARRPALILLRGDSGVGKTRLVGELQKLIAACSPDDRNGDGDDEVTLVLRGEAVEHGETELPYAPLLGAIRPLVRERHPAIEALTHGSRAQLATLLPALDDGSPTLEVRDGSGQLRLFEALLELLGALAEIQPLVLCLEDMHWADRSTRTFVAFLARSLRSERILLLLTYRSDELHRRHPLRPLISELERLEHTRRIELAPFDRDELAEALADILGDAPSEALVGRLFARSEGNPLYTEELLAAGLDGRGSAPQSLRDAFLSRIEGLSPDAQTVARAIAVGRELSERLVATLTGIAPDQLALALREALAEQVLLTAPDGYFSFRHELLREALYDDLLPGERGELHLALARAMEKTPCAPEDGGLEQATTIARHYSAAGDQPAALRATVRAALAARAVHAYGEAADLAERALELWPRVAEGDRPESIDQAELVVVAASMHGIGGDRARGEVLLQKALRELDPVADPRRYSAVLARLARTQWALNRQAEGVETAQRALALLPEDEDCPERASLLAWLSRTRLLRGRFRDAIADGEEALLAAHQAGDRRSESEALNTLGMAQMALGDEASGIGRLRCAAQIARDNDDIDDLGYANGNLADLLGLRGHTAEALRTAQEGLAEIPPRLGRTRDWLVLTVSELALEAGDWELARAHLNPPSAQTVGVLLIFHLLRQADLALGEGDEETAVRSLEEAEPLVAESSEPQWIGLLGSLLGDLRRRRRQLPEARAAVAAALDRLEVCTDDVMRIARLSAIGVRIEADIAQRGRDLRERGVVREAIARARIHVDRLRAAAQDGGPVEEAWSRTGQAELTRARGRHDPAPWLAAAAAWEAIERPYPVAITQWRAAEAQAERGDRVAAAESAFVSLELARGLGSRWLIAELEGLCERARLAPARVEGDDREATAQRNGSAADAEPDPFGLTKRELQVLTLVAEGATNRQIGAALFMAEKTASVHVSRILAKLGVQSRTQAAAVAHRLHLG